MEKRYYVRIERALDTSALSGFKCGVKSMDDFIHDQEKGPAPALQRPEVSARSHGRPALFQAAVLAALPPHRKRQTMAGRKSTHGLRLPAVRRYSRRISVLKREV